MRVEVYPDVDGDWRWRMLAGNNRKIANSGEGYENQEDALWGLDLVLSAQKAETVNASGFAVVNPPSPQTVTIDILEAPPVD